MTIAQTKDTSTTDIYYGWDFVGKDTNGAADIWSIGTLNNRYPYLATLPPAQ